MFDNITKLVLDLFIKIILFLFSNKIYKYTDNLYLRKAFKKINICKYILGILLVYLNLFLLIQTYKYFKNPNLFVLYDIKFDDSFNFINNKRIIEVNKITLSKNNKLTIDNNKLNKINSHFKIFKDPIKSKIYKLTNHIIEYSEREIKIILFKFIFILLKIFIFILLHFNLFEMKMNNKIFYFYFINISIILHYLIDSLIIYTNIYNLNLFFDLINYEIINILLFSLSFNYIIFDMLFFEKNKKFEKLFDENLLQLISFKNSVEDLKIMKEIKKKMKSENWMTILNLNYAYKKINNLASIIIWLLVFININ